MLDASRSIGGLTPADSMNAVTKWCRHHTPLLGSSCISAFELKHHPERGRTHVFFVLLSLNAGVQPGRTTKPSRMFDLCHAGLRAKSDLSLNMAEKVADADEEYSKGIQTRSMVEPEVLYILLTIMGYINLMPLFCERKELLTMNEPNKEWRKVLEEGTRIV